MEPRGRRFSIDERIRPGQKSDKKPEPSKLAEMEVSEETELDAYELAHLDIPEPPSRPKKLEELGKKEFTFPMAKGQEEIQSPIFNKKRKMNQDKGKSGFGIQLNAVPDTDAVKESPDLPKAEKKE